MVFNLTVIYLVTHRRTKYFGLGCGTAVCNGILSQHARNNAL